MPIATGSRLGAYEILSPLGAGGMGEVYRATDTNLKRQVAIKVLPAAVAADPARLARFRREAEISASLNHPNIAAIYGLDRQEGRDGQDGMSFIVLELVEGPTLADRIAQGPVPIDEALPIARQITDALEAAHERGIVHRDLKPANIKVRPDGAVKVLDFGLAKMLEPEVAAAGAGMSSPTITSPAMTHAGVILGTAAYMSPEQARGKAVDKRTDIWAFGCVLYEMLTGRRAFASDSNEVVDTLAAIVRSDVDLARLPSGTPSRVRQAIAACLQREQRQRVRDVGDLRLLLDGAFEFAAPRALNAPAAPRRVWQHPSVVATLWIVAFAGWALAGWTLLKPKAAEPRAPLRLAIPKQVTEDLGAVPDAPPPLALSPDGRVLVYAGVRAGTPQLFRLPLDQLSPTPIPGTEGSDSPFFSPDGGWIGFSSQGIKKVPAGGGDPITVVRAPGGVGAWGEPDSIVFGTMTFGSTLKQVSAAGGEARQIMKLDAVRGDLRNIHPHVLPGGGAFLFQASLSSGKEKIIAHALSTGAQRDVIEGGMPQYVPTGHLLFVKDGSLWAAPFDVARLEGTGAPVRLIENILGRPAIARNGTLAYLSGVTPRAKLVWVDRRGAEEALPIEPGDFGSVSLAPDGKRIAVTRGTFLSDVNVWICDLIRPSLTRLTTDPGINAWPIWTPDGKSIVYSSTRQSEGGRDIFRRAADGTGDVERLTKSARQQSPWSWSKDGRTIVLQEFRAGTGFAAATIPKDGGTVSALIQEASTNSALSPDGRWIAYNSSGEVWVRPFPNVTDARWQISTDRGNEPKWSASGRELFYRRGTSVMRVPIETDPAFRPGKPERLFDGDYQPGGGAKSWEVAPDGRFLMMKTLRADYTVNVVLNWSEELKRLVPTK